MILIFQEGYSGEGTTNSRCTKLHVLIHFILFLQDFPHILAEVLNFEWFTNEDILKLAVSSPQVQIFCKCTQKLQEKIHLFQMHVNASLVNKKCKKDASTKYCRGYSKTHFCPPPSRSIWPRPLFVLPPTTLRCRTYLPKSFSSLVNHEQCKISTH